MKLDAALTRLNQLIEQHIEYPNAQFVVSEEFGLSDRDLKELQELYDQQ